MSRVVLGALGLVLVGGCFSEPASVDLGAGTTGGSTSTPGSTSTGEAEEESSGTTGFNPTTGATSSSTTGGFNDVGTTGPCEPGTLGCECIQGSDPCEPGALCDADVCVQAPFDCVVSYGGGAAGFLDVQVTRVFADATLDPLPVVSFEGAHVVNDDVAGQDMLTECGGNLYAVSENDASIHAFRLQPDGAPQAVGTPLDLGAGGLRALECVRPANNFLIAWRVQSDGTIAASLVPRTEDGELGVQAQPLILPVVPTGDDPRRVRTAWAADSLTAYVIHDDEEPNVSHLISLTFNATGSELSLGESGPTTVVGIQARLGGLAYGPMQRLVLTGGQTGDPFGVGNLVRFEFVDDVATVGFEEVRDGPESTFLADSTSILIRPGGVLEGRALIGSPGGVGIAELEDGGLVLERVQSFAGLGRTTALPAHGGGVIVAVDAQSVLTFDGAGLVRKDVNVVDEVEHTIQAYTTSIAMPCAPRP